MHLSESSSRRTSVAIAVTGSDISHPARKTSLTVPDMNRYSRRLSTSSQASTFYGGRKRSFAMPRFFQPSTDATPHIMPKYSNSYKTEPDEGKRFRTKAVADVIDKILQEKLAGLTYCPDRCRKMIAPMTEEIKTEVKLLGFERYKLVCVVHIGSLNNQDLRVASRCLWDANFDRVASSSFSNETLFASASVFGVYQE